MTEPLELLAAAARRDLERLNFPAADWVEPQAAPDGTRALDVLVVGGGMIGQTVALALKAEGITHHRVIDQAARGSEGPWGTFARMRTLRSPKHVTGPDLGVPSLAFRAWFEAQHGEAAWNALGKIDRLDWLAYLLWVRETAGIAIENGTRLLTIRPEQGLWRADIARDGEPGVLWARTVVLALGRGPENRRVPEFAAVAHDPRVLHSCEPLEPAALRGERARGRDVLPLARAAAAQSLSPVRRSPLGARLRAPA